MHTTETIWHSVLLGFIFWVCLSLGCMGLLLVHSVTKARWGRAVLRILEAGAMNMPYLGILFAVILVLGMKDLYPWADPARHQMSGLALALTTKKAWYLNPGRFIAFSVIYFVLWSAMAAFMRKSGLKQDETGDLKELQRRTDWGAPLIVLHVVLITFAFTDWGMSLDPVWFSTIYGVWFIGGQGLAALALCAILLTTHKDLRKYVDAALTRDIGNLMLAFTMLWAYFSLSQYLIYWSGNLPEEIPFYIRRGTGGWDWMGLFLIIGQFLIPFLCLLSGRTKRTPNLLRNVAIWVFLVRFVDIYWIIVPTYRKTLSVNPMDLAALAGVGVLWWVLFQMHFNRAPKVCLHEPRLKEAVEHA
jgi:hypothetical protein